MNKALLELKQGTVQLARLVVYSGEPNPSLQATFDEVTATSKPEISQGLSLSFCAPDEVQKFAEDVDVG